MFYYHPPRVQENFRTMKCIKVCIDPVIDKHLIPYKYQATNNGILFIEDDGTFKPISNNSYYVLRMYQNIVTGGLYFELKFQDVSAKYWYTGIFDVGTILSAPARFEKSLVKSDIIKVSRHAPSSTRLQSNLNYLKACVELHRTKNGLSTINFIFKSLTTDQEIMKSIEGLKYTILEDSNAYIAAP